MAEKEKKPARIVYGLDDPIPGKVVLPLVLQQMRKRLPRPCLHERNQATGSC